jgi:hypothetical protein
MNIREVPLFDDGMTNEPMLKSKQKDHNMHKGRGQVDLRGMGAKWT